ncbi:MAG: hypothetical protein WAT79_05825, partial [Saprospiraceae bacterium]
MKYTNLRDFSLKSANIDNISASNIEKWVNVEPFNQIHHMLFDAKMKDERPDRSDFGIRNSITSFPINGLVLW